MQAPNIPHNEIDRLSALERTQLLHTPQEERFDRITRLARQLFQVKYALVTLVADDFQWFKSNQGFDANETTRDVSFCGHAILEHGIMEIPDTLEDRRFSDNPYVVGEPHLRFYAGAPLNTLDGLRLGTLCVLDDQPRKLTSEQLSALRSLADIVQEEINREQTEQLQQMLSERSHLERLSNLAKAAGSGVALLDIEGQITWANGDLAIAYGTTPDTLIGEQVTTMRQGERTEQKCIRAMENGLRKGSGFCVDIVHYRTDNEPFWAHWRATPMLNEARELQGYALIMTDLTRLRHKDLGLL